MPVIRVDQDIYDRGMAEREAKNLKNFSLVFRSLFQFRDDLLVKASETEVKEDE